MTDDERREKYRTSGNLKNLIITYNSGYNQIFYYQIFSEQFTLTQSICSGNELAYGGCEASMIEFSVIPDVDDLYGAVLTVRTNVDYISDTDVYLGKFKVIEDKLTKDRSHRTIKAYDAMYYVNNQDVTDWYKNYTFPAPMSKFREDLLTHISSLLDENFSFGYDEVTLPCDSLMVNAPSDVPNVVMSGDILKEICEVNCCFGVMDYSNFKFLTLADSYIEIDGSLYENIEYEEYEAGNIDGVEITQTQHEIKARYPENEDINSVYAVNLQLLCLTETDVKEAAKKFFQNKIGNTYPPTQLNCIGDPVTKCGDWVKVTTSDNNTVYFYVLERKLSGIRVLKDEYVANGTEKYEKQQTPTSSFSQVTSRIGGSFGGGVTFILPAETDTSAITNNTSNTVLTFIFNGVSEYAALHSQLNFTVETSVTTDETTGDEIYNDCIVTITYILDGTSVDTLQQIYGDGQQILTLNRLFEIADSGTHEIKVNIKAEGGSLT